MPSDTAELHFRPRDPGGTGGYQAYGLSPTFERRIDMLRLVYKSGSVRALAYYSMSRADYDPSLGRIEIAFGEILVEMIGRNLAGLYEKLTEHDVVWVAEADAPTARLLAATEAVVWSLKSGVLRSA